MVVKEIPIKKLPVVEPIKPVVSEPSIWSNKKRRIYLIALYAILTLLIAFGVFMVLAVQGIEIVPVFNSQTDNVFNNDFDNVINSNPTNNYDINVNFDMSDEFIDSVCGNSS